jgi:uncharacterized protein (DUF1501 family)
MQHINLITRRSFLDRSVKTSIAVALSTLVDIPFVMKRALAEGSIGLNGKKVLFIWLRGANDSLNSVIPIQDTAYAANRPTLAIPKDINTNYATSGIPADFPINSLSTDPTYSYGNAIRLGNGFAALHPSLKFLAPVYNDGDLALIHRTAYPKQSRSHFDSQRYWENGNPNNNLVQDGIFYRTILESGLANSAPLTGVSIQSSLPLILRGSDAPMTNLTDPTRYDLLGIPNDAGGNLKALNFLIGANNLPFPTKMNRELLQLQYDNLNNTLKLPLFDATNGFFTEANNTYRDSVITDNDSAWAAANGNEGYYLFPTTNIKNGGWRRPDGTNVANKYAVDPGHQSFFNNLKAAALVLNKTDAIISGTELGGFDTHKGQGGVTGNNPNTHPQLNKTVGWALYALKRYFTRYAERATWNDVVVVTLSEFGRTTIENSDLGTDHAEAGVMFVAGGAIKGYNKGNPYGVFNCGTSGPLARVPGSGGTMFGVGGRYLQRNTDYRSVLGEIIRKHLGATSDQVKRIIPGYAKEPELAGQRQDAASSVDGTHILGEVGIL